MAKSFSEVWIPGCASLPFAERNPRAAGCCLRQAHVQNTSTGALQASKAQNRVVQCPQAAPEGLALRTVPGKAGLQNQLQLQTCLTEGRCRQQSPGATRET